ncbi:hypothetical protein PVAND_005009 [Polypedilum vanderplanki]|uniref:Uncharacterized protein n=1 Tax=Polypedilum vanderplanki TaxID=319348 RepID=A0A9J6BZA0_POLVA|nr:hypothetical protein PVAND_005009 [Polypedilum vanderplanki]
MNQINDPALNAKVKKTTEKISENIHILSNEPSLAFYRIQENVRKTVPVIIEKRADVEKLKTDLQGVIFDLEYCSSHLKSIENAEQPLISIQESLKNAIFLRQQLKYEEQRRKKDSSNKDTNNIYKRFSAHLPIDMSLDSVTNRVENMMGINNTTTAQTTSQSQAELQRSHTTLH